MAAWAEAQGKMLSGEISSSEGYDSSTNSYQTYYSPEVTYQYEVNGVEYTGSRLTELPDRYGSRGDVEKFLASHKAGAAVKVFYDPENPAHSILEKGLGSLGNKQLALAGGIFGGVLAAAGGFSILFLVFMLILVCVVLGGVFWVISQVLQF